jgi:hypothetical protein
VPPRRAVAPDAVRRVLAAIESGRAPERPALAAAVRHLLADLAERSPGHAVEVRVPPFGAVQCVEGPRHTRGTPANVIETDPVTWVLLATGRMRFGEAVDAGRVAASGARADLAPFLLGAAAEWA